MLHGALQGLLAQLFSWEEGGEPGEYWLGL